MTQDAMLYGLGLAGTAVTGFFAGWFTKGYKDKKRLKAAEVTFQQLQAVISSNRQLSSDNQQLRLSISEEKLARENEVSELRKMISQSQEGLEGA